MSDSRATKDIRLRLELDLKPVRVIPLGRMLSLAEAEGLCFEPYGHGRAVYRFFEVRGSMVPAEETPLERSLRERETQSLVSEFSPESEVYSLTIDFDPGNEFLRVKSFTFRGENVERIVSLTEYGYQPFITAWSDCIRLFRFLLSGVGGPR